MVSGRDFQPAGEAVHHLPFLFQHFCDKKLPGRALVYHEYRGSLQYAGEILAQILHTTGADEMSLSRTNPSAKKRIKAIEVTYLLAPATVGAATHFHPLERVINYFIFKFPLQLLHQQKFLGGAGIQI